MSLVSINSASAYKTLTHQHIVREAWELLTMQYTYLESAQMSSFIGDNESNLWSGTIAAGALVEDDIFDDIVYHYVIPSMAHYWVADNGVVRVLKRA